ncbi:hypothetical protein PR048_028582 [Dryococelus australis]|uniref:Integrase catalytic domain-containing protein n=1 Tax=Dryococelus australis TaxID=614101 RepID=A0ABQ9GAZ6_9NEOP|nr:hypothetical protein PR048_028582 [Dryococelus australis]
MESSVKVALNEKPTDSNLDDRKERRKWMRPIDCLEKWFQYFVVFKGDFSKFRTIFFIRNKNEVFGKLKEFLTKADILGHKVMMCIQCDNGGELNNESLHSFLNIEIRYTMPHTPQQNGCAERENCTIVETA